MTDVFRSDLLLLCSNALTFNKEGTVYHTTARVLRLIGMKLLQTVDRLVKILQIYDFSSD